MFRVIVFMFLVKFSSSQYEGETCITTSGSEGICTKFINCKSALRNIRYGIPPKTCSFDRDVPIVCCSDVTPTVHMETETAVKWTTPQTTTEQTTTERTTTTERITTTERTTTERTTTTTEKTVSRFSQNECPPLPLNKTEAKTGKKARDKCIEYQSQLVYPCKEDNSDRWNNCWNDLSAFIVGGEETFESEFPHMTLLGFGEPPDISFQCGGALISDKYVMTAGHCVSSRLGPLTYALIGIINRNNYTADQLHKIIRIIVHPDYKAPIKYNDLALLELESRVELTPYIVPACLDVLGAVPNTGTATGWGLTGFRGDPSDLLLKVNLDRFEDAQCSDSFPVNRNMREGYTPNSQLCFGGKGASKDTCQGDSGGPLQIKDPTIHCMYTVIGITSFGRSCGMKDQPALYTKVAHYVDWIESIVWPDPA